MMLRYCDTPTVSSKSKQLLQITEALYMHRWNEAALEMQCGINVLGSEQQGPRWRCSHQTPSPHALCLCCAWHSSVPCCGLVDRVLQWMGFPGPCLNLVPIHGSCGRCTTACSEVPVFQAQKWKLGSMRGGAGRAGKGVEKCSYEICI